MDQKKLNEYNISGFSENLWPPSSKGKIKTIEEEIKFLTQLSMLVQEKNEQYKNIIEEKIKNKIGYRTIDEEFEYDFEKNQKGNSNSNKIKSKNSKKLNKYFLVLKNTAYHIYKLQLIQFAESIKRIYKKTNSNEYFITFDNTDEDIPPVILNETDYNNLISIRDKYPNNDILASFISKEDCINPNSINNTKKAKTLTPKKNNKNSLPLVKENQMKSKDDTYTGEIINKGNFHFLSGYNICHQCKLQKIDEDLIKCQYVHISPHPQNQNNNSANNTHSHNKMNKNKNNQSNINSENPINYFFIGQSAIILSNDKIYYLKNYDDSIKELVDNYFVKLKENNKKCEKYFCKNCLRTIYDIDINEIKKKNFRCPSCSNRCNCTRCIRNENLIKQIAYYLNNYGDLDKLYDFMVRQNSIFEKLKDYLVCSKFICFDFNTKNYTPLKLNIPPQKKPSGGSQDGQEKNNVLNSLDLLKYKYNLEKMQIDFCNTFDEANLKKQLYDTEFYKLKESTSKEKEKKCKKLIGKKIKKTNNKKKIGVRKKFGKK